MRLAVVTMAMCGFNFRFFFDDGVRRKRDEKLAVLNAFEAQKIVRQCANIFSHAAQGDDFHAVVVADVNVQDGDN